MVAPTLTVDTSGNPFVEFFIDAGDLDPAAERLRLYRFSDNRQWKVRGGWDIAVGVAVLDFECPFGVDATYRAEVFDGAGLSLGFTDYATVTLDVGSVWVHNPLVPAEGIELGAAALLDDSGARATRRPIVGSVVYTEGSMLGRWIGSGRRGVVDYSLGFAVESLDLADRFQGMLGDYNTRQVGVLCVRTPPPVRIPRTFFTSVPDPTEVSVDVQWGGQRTDIVFTATEVDPPFVGLVTPLLTYDDLDAAYSTYDERDAAYATYTDMDRDYSLAGLAG